MTDAVSEGRGFRQLLCRREPHTFDQPVLAALVTHPVRGRTVEVVGSLQVFRLFT